MGKTFTAVFNEDTFTIMCNGACVASIDLEKKEKHVYDEALYEQAAEKLLDVFNTIRLRMPRNSYF